MVSFQCNIALDKQVIILICVKGLKRQICKQIGGKLVFVSSSSTTTTTKKQQQQQVLRLLSVMSNNIS